MGFAPEQVRRCPPRSQCMSVSAAFRRRSARTKVSEGCPFETRITRPHQAPSAAAATRPAARQLQRYLSVPTHELRRAVAGQGGALSLVPAAAPVGEGAVVGPLVAHVTMSDRRLRQGGRGTDRAARRARADVWISDIQVGLTDTLAIRLGRRPNLEAPITRRNRPLLSVGADNESPSSTRRGPRSCPSSAPRGLRAECETVRNAKWRPG